MTDDEKVTVTEYITFLPNGGSKHVLTFPDGSTEERTFDVAPIGFISGPPFKLDTAAERGIVAVTRIVRGT